jgi:class 3 adenylate cyclase
MFDGTDAHEGQSETRADLRTFLIADLRGFTAYAERSGDVAAAELARRFAELVGQGVAGCGGLVIELRGDEAMAAFTSSRAAVRASIAVQERCRGVGGVPLPLGLGIGLDAGEAVAVGQGFRARALNVASRLCSAADSGEILATETVCRLAGPVEEAGFSSLRHLRVKGVSERLAVRLVEPRRALPPLPSTPKTRGRRRLPAIGRRGATVLAVAALALAVLIAAGLSRRGGGGVDLRANSVAVIDQGTGQVIGDVHLPTKPGEVAANGRYVWVAQEGSESVVRIDARTLKTRFAGVGIDPAALAVGLGQVWAYDATVGQVAEIDPRFREPPNPIRLPHCDPGRCVAGGIAVGEGGIWVGRSYATAFADGTDSNPGVVWKLSSSFAIAETIPRVPADRLALAPHSVWTYGDYGWHVSETDSRSRSPLQRIPLPGIAAAFNQPGMTYAFGHAWVVDPTASSPTLFEISPKASGGGLQPTIPIPAGSFGITHDDRWLWITTAGGGTLLKVDPFAKRVVATYRLGHEAFGVAVADGRVWVALGKASAD